MYIQIHSPCFRFGGALALGTMHGCRRLSISCLLHLPQPGRQPGTAHRALGQDSKGGDVMEGVFRGSVISSLCSC